MLSTPSLRIDQSEVIVYISGTKLLCSSLNPYPFYAIFRFMSIRLISLATHSAWLAIFLVALCII